MSKGISTIYMKVKKTQVVELNDVNQFKTQILKLDFAFMRTWLSEVNALISIVSESLTCGNTNENNIWVKTARRVKIFYFFIEFVIEASKI